MKYVSAIIAADKSIIMFSDKSVLYHAVKQFDGCDCVNEIIAAVPNRALDYYKRELAGFNKRLVLTVAETFHEAINEGLNCVRENCNMVAVHEGVRPFVSFEEINATIKSAEEIVSVVATRATDTVKRGCNEIIIDTIDRRFLWSIRSPLAMSLKDLRHACGRLAEKGSEYNNVAEFIIHLNWLGIDVRIVEGRYENVEYK